MTSAIIRARAASRQSYISCTPTPAIKGNEGDPQSLTQPVSALATCTWLLIEDRLVGSDLFVGSECNSFGRIEHHSPHFIYRHWLPDTEMDALGPKFLRAQ